MSEVLRRLSTLHEELLLRQVSQHIKARSHSIGFSENKIGLASRRRVTRHVVRWPYGIGSLRRAYLFKTWGTNLRKRVTLWRT